MYIVRTKVFVVIHKLFKTLTNYYKYFTWGEEKKKRVLDYKAGGVTFPEALLMETILVFSDGERQAAAFLQVKNRK